MIVAVATLIISAVTTTCLLMGDYGQAIAFVIVGIAASVVYRRKEDENNENN